jgi:hypothetical protein
MDGPNNVSKVWVIGPLVPDEKGLEAEISDHRHHVENRSDDADDTKVVWPKQSRQDHGTARTHNQVADCCEGKDPCPRTR